MTQAVELPLPPTRASERRLVGGVCFAHFVSHYYIMLLAPLFLFVREDYGVTYTELGLALTAFNVVSTALQTPTGFLVDRVSARMRHHRGPAAGRRRHRDRGAGQLVLGVRRDVRASRALPTRSITRPTTRCCRSTCRPSAPDACSPSTPSPACSATRWRRRRCSVPAEPRGLARRVSRARPCSAWWPRSCSCCSASRSAESAAKTRKQRDTPTPPRDGWRLLIVAADPAQPRVLHPALVLRRRAQQLSGGRARRALRHAGRGRQYSALTGAPHHERGRRAGRRRAHRLHLAPRPGRRRRADGDRDRVRARRPRSTSTRWRWCC